MKLKYKIMTLIGVVAVVAYSAAVFADEDDEETVPMSQVPQVVKDTLKKYADESEVKKVEKGKDGGKKVFEFDIEKNGKKFEVAITPKGKFWGMEEDIALSAIPDAAQNALKAEAGDGTISGTEKAVDRKNKVTYEADIHKGGKKYEVSVDAEGHIVNKEKASSDEKGEGKEKD
jgi:hypothetical protein